MKFLLIFLLLVPSYSYAQDECKEAVVLLEKGKPSPCTGFLFSPEAEKNATKAYLEAQYYKELSELLHQKNESQAKQLSILDERLMLYVKSTTELAEEVVRKQDQDFWQKTLYFGLGIAVTGLSVYAASQFQK